MAQIDPKYINGGKVAQRPVLGEELYVLTPQGYTLNVGQVKSAEYEEGGGSGFNVKTTKIVDDQSIFVSLANPQLHIPLVWD